MLMLVINGRVIYFQSGPLDDKEEMTNLIEQEVTSPVLSLTYMFTTLLIINRCFNTIIQAQGFSDIHFHAFHP